MYLSLFIIFCVALSQVQADCSADCPDTEYVVWALADSCLVFRNKCYFDKENCVRKPPLTIVSKEECQKKCRDICPKIFEPVSGIYKGQIRTFGNACEMGVHSCKTGETFLLVLKDN